MQIPTLASLWLVAQLGLAQELPSYVQFQGNASAPINGVSPEVRETLKQADTSPNASHSVMLSAPGNGDWNWTLQISDVNVPAISNTTPDAHVAFTTWHFSRADEEPMSSKRDEDSPVCAYLMDINFPYNVSSQWDRNDSSCVSALGASCASALSAVRRTENCETRNAPSNLFNDDKCAGMLTGGPAFHDGIVTQGLAFDARNVSDGAWAYALTPPYEAGNTNTFQAATERLRIMVLTGPEGSEAFCNRVARTVEIGAEDDSDDGDGQDGESGDADGDDSSGGGEEEGDESDAISHLPHVGGLAASAVACGFTAYWLL